MKKSAGLVLIFTFIVLFGFYFSSKRPNPNETLNSPNSEPTPAANISVKPSTKPITVKTPTAVPSQTVKTDTMTMDQVATHNSKKDCYLVIKNNVYDVSSYIVNHPGGQGKIVSKCGQEVTGIFAEIHSSFAWDLLKKYKVGQV